MSTETGVTYVKITDKNNKSKLWKINSFVGVSQMGSTRTKNIGGIQCLKTVDDLLYEDKDNGRVYQYSKNTSFIVEGSRSLKLLGFDSSDNVYLAKMKDGKTSTVCYAGVTGSSTGSSTDSAAEISWNTVNLGKSVDPSEIHVTDSGEIYIVSTSNNYLDKVFSQNSTGSSSVSASLSASDSESSSSITGRTKYSGTLECIFDTGFITVVNGQLVHNNFAG
jgi:hypothetical protein